MSAVPGSSLPAKAIFRRRAAKMNDRDVTHRQDGERQAARRLFAETFAVPLLEPDSPEPEMRYDEDRCLNVLPDGRAFIETGLSGRGADTLTEVRAEQDDFDRGDARQVSGRLDTFTKVRREGDDYESRLLTLATETRAPGERDDFARGDTDPVDHRFALGEHGTGTQTFVRREQDDSARAESWAGTQTAVRSEADDFTSECVSHDQRPQTANLHP
jgi:hypothetical protein